MLKPTIFREYDIRGEADRELPDADVETLGRAIGTYLQRLRAAGTIYGAEDGIRWRISDAERLAQARQRLDA